MDNYQIPQHHNKSYSFKDDNRELYGVNISKLRQWHKEREKKMLNEENSIQELAVAKVRGFLDAIGK